MSDLAEIGHRGGSRGFEEGLETEFEVQGGGSTAAGLAARIGGYHPLRARTIEMAKYVSRLAHEVGSPAWVQKWHRELASKLLSCCDYLVFRHYWRIDLVRLHQAFHCCKTHLCPMCARVRGAKLLRQYLLRFEHLRVKHPAARLFMVGLTVKDGDDALERYMHLDSAARSLFSRGLNKKRGASDNPLAGCLGGVSTYEFKRGSGSGLFHPHIHGLVLSEVAPDQAALSSWWHRETGDSFVVDVQEPPVDGPDGVLGVFMECFKYPLKFAAMSLEDNYNVALMLRGKHMVRPFGSFKGIDISQMDDDPVAADEPFIELFYKYLEGVGYGFVPERSGPPQEQRSSIEGPGVSGAIVNDLDEALLPF